MRKQWSAAVIAAMLVSGVTVSAQETLSPKTARVGWVMVIVGGLMMIPAGDTYRVLGDNYCVTDRSVDAGSCRTPAVVVKTGLVMMGSGALLAFVGSRPVTRHLAVAPTRTGLGGAVVVRWGK